MNTNHRTLMSGIITLTLMTLLGCSSQPATTPQPIVLPASATPTEVIALPTPTESALLASPPPVSPAPGQGAPLSLTLPVLAGTPVPMPKEPITPDNVDRIQQLAMWGRGQIKKVTYSSDGQFLTVGTTAGVWLHDAKTLELRRFMLTNEELMTMAFLSDGQLIAQVGGRTINRWDITTGILIGSWQVGVDFLEKVAFAPDGTKLASVLRVMGAQIGVWEIQSGQLLYVLERQPRVELLVSRLAFSPDGTLLASAMIPNPDTPQFSATLTNAIELWDVKTGTLVHTLSLPDQNEISSLAFSPDGNLLASSHDKDIRVWEVKTGALLHTLQGHTATVVSDGLSFSPDGQRLTSVGFDQTIRLWDVDEGKLLQTLMELDLWALYLAFSADGSTLVAVGEKNFRDYTLRLWNTSTGAVLGELEGYDDAISDLAISPDGTLYTGHTDNIRVRQWNIQTGQIIRNFPEHVGSKFGFYETDIAISANGQTLAASEYNPYPSVLIWDTATGQLIQTLEDYDQSVESLALSPDGTLIASSEGKVAYVYNTQTGQQLYGLSVDEERVSVSYLVFSPDGSKLASHEQKLHLFEVKTGGLLFTLDQGWLPAFSPDGTMLATGDTEGKIALWNTETGELLRPLADQKSLVRDLTFSPNGQLLASVITDHAIYLWDVETGRLLRVFEGLPFVKGVTFLRDGKMLLSSSKDGMVRFWGVPSQ